MRVTRPEVRDLRRVGGVADVQEPGALRVERLHQHVSLDVEVVRRAVGARRVAALLAGNRPGANGLQPERTVRSGPPTLAVERAAQRGDHQHTVAGTPGGEVL